MRLECGCGEASRGHPQQRVTGLPNEPALERSEERREESGERGSRGVKREGRRGERGEERGARGGRHRGCVGGVR